LWEHVTRDAARLKKPPRTASPPVKPQTPSAPRPAKSPGESAERAIERIAAARKLKPVPKQPAPELGHGDIAGVDKRSAERMRRGRMPIDGTLDLHGFTQDQARRELADYLAGAQDAGKRCVIVVTGKGDITQGGGVIRTQTPRWLNAPENRARILAFDYAQPKHGGMGALYVLLRKVRP